MKLEVPEGKYVLAVSGGVDSMALLDLLANKPGLELIVAHLDHGIRPDSSKDAQLVRGVAAEHGIPYEGARLSLGPKISEEKARQQRYKFLEMMAQKHKADAIITAHHQDDLIETALLNILRGSGPQGMVSLISNNKVIRPLASIAKQKIVTYAKQKGLHWREDETNTDTTYLRNYLRVNIIPNMTARQRREILKNIEIVAKNRPTQNALIATISRNMNKSGYIDRQLFSRLPAQLGNEVITHRLRLLGYRQFDKKTIDRINGLLRTAAVGTKHDVGSGVTLNVDKLGASFKASG